MPVNPTSTVNPTVRGTLTLSATCTQKGVPTDPTSLTFEFRVPGSSVKTVWTWGQGVQIYRDTPIQPGVFHVDLPLTASGRWYWGFYPTGQGQGVIEGYFDVEPSMVQ